MKINLLPRSWNGILISAMSVAVSTLQIASIHSQTTNVQVGTGTGTNANSPISTFYGYSYNQQIYTAGEIQAAGATGLQEISKIRFQFASGANNNSDNWTVFLGHTNKTSFNSTTDWISTSGLMNCFTGTVMMPTAGNWMEITLTTPFQWDGVSNIVVAIDENQSGFSSSNGLWYKSDLGSDRSIYYRDDSTNPDPTSPPTATGRLGSVPNIQFEMTAAPDCVGSPAIASIISSNGSVFCFGDQATLNIANAPFETGITYQWQSFDGFTWNNIVGETGTSFITDSLAVSTDYQLVVGCSISGNSSNSTPITLTVNPLPTVVVDVVEGAFCNGGNITINASGASTYLWTPASGLNNTTVASVLASPSTTTTYIVTGTDINGCSNTTQSTINPYNEISATAVINPADLCTAGTTVATAISGLPTIPGGSWTYRFLESDGVTEAQTWSSANTFNYIPSQDGNYEFYYQALNTGCGIMLDPVQFNFLVGFGADVTVVDYNCVNMGGSILLDNAFGQKEVTSVYSNTFDGNASLTGVTLTGNASITNDRLQLTDSQTGVSGFGMIDFGGNSYGDNNSFKMNFDLTADLPINNFGTGGADGISYSFGNDANPSANGSGHNGKGTKLRLSFDSAGNSSENGNQSGIYLVYGWTASSAFGPGSAQTIAYSSNLSSWKGQTDVPVEFEINDAGLATLWVNGTLIFDQIQMPSAYMTADVTSWTHLFSAGTGGDAERHAVSNWSLEKSTFLYGITTTTPSMPTSWQSSSVFDNLTPGTYYLWMTKDATGTCSKNVDTVIIDNSNPTVDLGNDTTICEGSVLTLDAGNAGATYIWSNTNAATQTIDVSNAGIYIVYVTDLIGCLGIGAINVDVMDAPTGTGIFMQGTYPSHTFTVLNPQNAITYDWDFGDGTTVMNAPSTVSHVFGQTGTTFVTVTMSNECGATDVTEQFDIINTLSISENEMDGVKIYPNPATEKFTVKLAQSNNASLKVTSVTGAVMITNVEFNEEFTVNVNDWNPGVYFVQVNNDGRTITERVVVR